MQLITPERFAQAFRSVAATVELELVRCWRSPKAYTSLIRSTALPAIAADLGQRVYSQRDYYWLDAIFYEEGDDVHFPPGSTYAKCVSVALEHENIAKDSVIEMNKLQLFNTPLKVLVTYAKLEQHHNLLDRYARIVSEADIFGDFSTQRRQLVVFGDLVAGDVSWGFYVYKDGAFVGF